MDVTTIVVAASIPSALTGFCFWLIQQKIEKNEKRRDKKAEAREEARIKNEVLMIKSISASIALGEAAAIALKRGKANGETERALEIAKNIKTEQEDFLALQGVRSLY